MNNKPVIFPKVSMIEKDLVAKAARNNAQWCDFVCSSHGYTGVWTESMWVNMADNLPFDPNAVTFSDNESIFDQRKGLEELNSNSSLHQIAVKDSFNTLDLSDLGFSILFKANWIFKLPVDGQDLERFCWVNIRNTAALGLWESAWSEFNQVPYRASNCLFCPELLAIPPIQILLAFKNNKPAGGGIITAGNEVVGISNLFYLPGECVSIWNGLCDQANQFYPNSSVVSYVADNSLPSAVEVGFKPIGELRVWKKP